MGFVTVNDTKFYYEIHGKGEPLLFISGLGRDHSIWDHLVPYLQDSFQVILFDNRGVGLTDTTDHTYSTELMAHDTAEVIDALGFDKVNVVGHSMGGGIAQSLAIHHPEKVKKLILCSTFAKLCKRSHLIMETIVNMMEKELSVELIVQLNLGWLFSNDTLGNEELMHKLMQHKVDAKPQTFIGFKSQVDACSNHNCQDLVQNIKTETLVLVGKDDILTPLNNSEELSNNIPNASLQIIPGAGHMIQTEQPKKFLELVVPFLHE